MRMSLVKMHGCGNDFVILDHLRQGTPVPLGSREARHLASRHFGVGADGVLVLRRSEIGADAAWDFFNSDGSSAEMCGNAARCVIRLLTERYSTPGTVLSIETLAGIIKGKLLPDGRSEITMFGVPPQGFRYDERIISTEKNAFQTLNINTGVPHAVIEVKDLASYPVSSVGRLLVGHAAFKPAGTNATFFQRLTSNKIMATTFERGVEEQTFACGTGAVAAAIIFAEAYAQVFPIEVSVPGGTLEVDMSPISKKMLLRGPTQLVFEAELEAPDPNFEEPSLFGSKKGKG